MHRSVIIPILLKIRDVETKKGSGREGLSVYLEGEQDLAFGKKRTKGGRRGKTIRVDSKARCTMDRNKDPHVPLWEQNSGICL